MSLHVLPADDLKEHTLESTCECCPRMEIEDGEMIFIHNSWDGREFKEHDHDQNIS